MTVAELLGARQTLQRVLLKIHDTLALRETTYDQRVQLHDLKQTLEQAGRGLDRAH